MRDGEQQPLTLHHKFFRLRLGLHKALATALITPYVAHGVEYEQGGGDNGKESEYTYTHDGIAA